MAKVLLDEICARERNWTPTYAFLTRQEERTSGMDRCEECEHLWRVYRTATIQFVQLYEEIEAMTEDQGLEKLNEMTTKTAAAERARQRLAEHQATTGHR